MKKSATFPFFIGIFLILISISSQAKILMIDDKTEFYDILPHTSIFIDKSRKLTFNDIREKELLFKPNDKKLLGYGYSPDFNVWVQFTLKNNSSKTLTKIIEYDNALTTHINFYNPDENYKEKRDGLFQIDKNRKTIKPIFKINLKPYETKIYYIQASSYITTLIIKLNLWNSQDLYTKEIKHQLMLALFFGAMLILAFYNLFIYFFTKDISYLFYVLYIIGIIIHHLIFVGLANIYLLNQTMIFYIISFATILAAFPIFSLGLFTKSFLQTKQYPWFDKVLNLFLILMPISIIVFSSTDLFNTYRNLLSFCFIIYLMIVAFYATFRRNRQAYFVLFGEIIIASAFTSMYLSSVGIFNMYNIFPYFVETALVLEAIIFSIALADRIKQLQKEKNDVSQKLIIQQKNEKERLAIQVEEKTADLKTALDEKGILLKELNHRVKNNMQTIVSLIRLQSDEVSDKKIQNIFTTIQNRINAMIHLHELLYKKENITYVNAYEYFKNLIEELKESYKNEVRIYFNIQSELKTEQAVYCGLILNELITNSLKYAFPDGIGEIDITLSKKNSLYSLVVNDNGIGYDKNSVSNSLGLILVNTLATQQLHGKITIEPELGVHVKIEWEQNENS